MKRRVMLYTTLVLSVAAWATVPAAQTPKGSPPPTYGQTRLPRYDARFIRQSHLIVTLIVPSASLQNLLAPGYTAPPGSTSAVIVTFVLQQREELPRAIGAVAAGTYGPASAMIVYADTLNPRGHYEQFNLDNERSTDDSTNLVNELWGDGSARTATSLTIDLKEVVREEEEDAHHDAKTNAPIIRFSGRVENDTTGLAFGVHVIFPADIWTPVRNSLTKGPDGLTEPFRFVNGAARPPMPNAAIAQVVNDDRVTISSDDAHLKLEVPDRRLRLPEGTLPIVGVGPTVTLIRTRENFQLKCDVTVCP